jgi:hypothetical protein
VQSGCGECVSNIGFPLVAVSPGISHVAWVAGARAGGCDVHYNLSLQQTGSANRTPLRGLPEQTGNTRITIEGLRWADANTLVVDLTSATFNVTNDDDPTCKSTNATSMRLRCDTAGVCTTTRAVATSSIGELPYRTSTRGDALTLNDPVDDGPAHLATITWTDGQTQRITFDSTAWAP